MSTDGTPLLPAPSGATSLIRELLSFSVRGCAVLLMGLGTLLAWPALAWIVFGVVAPIVIVIASRRPDANPFNLLKAVSVAVASLCVLVATTRGPGHPGGIATVIAVVFGANILEAVLSDASRGRWLNVTAGAILLVTLPSPHGISVPAERPGVMLYAIEPLWLVMYTAWNWAFVGARAPRTAKAHAAVLLAPLLADWWLPGLWAQARAYTLGGHQLYALAHPRARRSLDIVGHDERLRAAAAPLALVALLLGGWVLLHGAARA